MRIVHIVHSLPDECATRVMALALQQRRRSIHAEVILLDSGDAPAREQRLRYDSHVGVPVQRLVLAPSTAASSLLRMLAAVGSLDLVHVHGNSRLFAGLALVGRWTGKPCLSSGTDWRAPPAPMQLFRRAVRPQAAPDRADPDPATPELLIAKVADRQIEVYRRILGAPIRTLMGVSIRTLGRDQAVAFIDQRLAGEEAVRVGFVNAHSLNIAARNERYRAVLERFIVLNDGLGIDIASWIKYGRRFDDNLNGTDFVPHFLSSTRHRLRIFLVGTSEAAVAEAARMMSLRFPRHRFVGFRNGFFDGPEDIEATCRKIKESGADCVLFGMGNPLQELFIDAHGDKTGARLLMGVGALLDFQAGVVRRAPVWVRRMHAEWGYRLLQEPRRLARRYLVGNAVFIGRAILDARR